MKKSFLVYIVALVSVLTLESCVSNYVVSTPIPYKQNTKLATIPNKSLNFAKQSLNNRNSLDAVLASIDKVEKSLEESKLHEYNTKINALLAEAESYLGTPYRFGGMSRRGIDCSGFVLSVFGAAMGIHLPRIAASQAGEGESVNKDELKKGDLVFFSQGRRMSHVGIVHNVSEEGVVTFIHASSSKGVSYATLSDKYWSPRFRFAKRIVDENNVFDITHPATDTYAQN